MKAQTVVSKPRTLLELAILAKGGKRAPARSPHAASCSQRKKDARLRSAKTLGDWARILKGDREVPCVSGASRGEDMNPYPSPSNSEHESKGLCFEHGNSSVH